MSRCFYFFYPSLVYRFLYDTYYRLHFFGLLFQVFWYCLVVLFLMLLVDCSVFWFLLTVLV